MTRQERIIQVAQSYLGKTEKPGNMGFNDATFQQKMAHVGWQLTQAWCAYLAELILREANPDLDAILSQLFSGSSTGTYKNFELDKSGLFLVSQEPEPGDVIIYRHGVGWTGHTGVVESRKENKTTNIEGNTNDDGAREGYEVARRTRSIKAPLKKDGLNFVGCIRIIAPQTSL